MVGWHWLFPVVFIAAVGLSVILTWIVRETAVASGWATPPPSARHIHKTAIPRLGGIAIFATFAIITSVTYALLRLTGTGSAGSRELLALIVPGTILFGVGVVDDFIDVSPLAKISFQIPAGLALSFIGLNCIELHTTHAWLNIGVATISTLAWVIGITNAVNIIDGVDGLAGGSMLFSVLAIGVVAIIGGYHTVAFLAVVLAGALLGFLRFNFHPATIFLGDGGSMFIGYVLSALSLACKRGNMSPVVALSIPALLLGFPIVEMAVSILRRFVSGKRIFAADREHIHHRLLELGLNQRQVVGILYGFSAISCLVAILLMYTEPVGGLILLVLLAVFVGAALHRLEYPELREFGELFNRMSQKRQMMANNVLLRSLAKRLNDCHRMEEIYIELGETFRKIGLYEFELMVVGINKLGANLRKSVASEAVEAEAWSLDIDIRNTDLGLLGYLRVYSAHNRAHFDINLLLDGVSQSLSRAIVRAEYENFVARKVHNRNVRPELIRPFPISVREESVMPLSAQLAEELPDGFIAN